MTCLFRSQKKCVEILEALGDMVFSSGEHDKATARYTFALSLSPPNPTDILVRARASKGLLNDALTDANEVYALCRI